MDITNKLLSDEELRTFYIENCAYEMAGCKYSELTYIAKQGIDKLVDDILLPVFNAQKHLYAESEAIKAISGVAKAVINKGENPQYYDRMMFEVSQKAPVLYLQICNLVGQYQKIERGRIK